MINTSIEVQFDPALVEEAVFLKMRGLADTDPMARAFHRRRELLYGAQGPASQDEKAFENLCRDYFSQTGLDELLKDIVNEFRLLAHPDILVFFKKVERRKQQQVQLYCQGRLKTVFIGLQVAFILNDEGGLKDYLRQELTHVEDMLDPAFQYNPYPAFGGATEIEDWLIRERFCQLWDLYVHLRLKGKKAMENLGGVQQDAIGRFVESVCAGGRYTQEELLKLTRGLRVHCAGNG